MKDTLQNVHGCINTFPVDSDYHRKRGFCPTAYWTTPGLKVTRLRLLSDPGFPYWDVSYCHGTLDGKDVDVGLPFYQLPKRRMREFIVKMAIKDNVHAKSLGILTNISTCC